MKKLLLLLILSFFSAQSFSASCPDGSEPVKSVSADGTYYEYKCGGQASSSSASNSKAGTVKVAMKPDTGEWILIYENAESQFLYIDENTIKERNGHVYSWGLSDYVYSNSGYMSAKIYRQTDCELYRVKILSGVFYKQTMGTGNNVSHTHPNPQWSYPLPGTFEDGLVGYVCDYVK